MVTFVRPVRKTLGIQDVDIAFVSWDQFNDAILIGKWMERLPDMMPTVEHLSELGDDSDMRAAINRVIAGCISIPAAEDGSSVVQQLTVADVKAMPIMTLLEAVLVIMEVNLDFFLQSLQTCMGIRARMLSTGSPLLSNSSAPVTTTPSSDAIPSAS